MTDDCHPDPTPALVPRLYRGANQVRWDDTNEKEKEVMLMGHSRSEPSLPSQGSPDPVVGDKRRPYEKGRGGSCTLPERRPCGRRQAPTLPNKVAEGLVPSRRAGGSIGSPRGTESCLARARRTNRLLSLRGVPTRPGRRSNPRGCHTPITRD